MIEILLAILALAVPATALFFEWSARKRDVSQAEIARLLEESRYAHEREMRATERLCEWARKATAELSLVDHLLNNSNDHEVRLIDDRERIEIAARISALVDEGRWLFPNHHPEKFGHEKPELNHGFRDNRLDALVKAYSQLMGDEAVEPSNLRKDFVRKVQKLAIPLSGQLARE